MHSVRIDLTKKLGGMKPINGVGNGPLTGRFCRDRRAEFTRAGIPYSRLHDTEGQMGSGEFVNIHCIFKNFDADVNDPASYNFAETDGNSSAIMLASYGSECEMRSLASTELRGSVASRLRFLTRSIRLMKYLALSRAIRKSSR